MVFDSGLLSTKDIYGSSLRWSLGANQDPMPLDIILLIGGQEVVRLKTIVRFIDGDTMELRADMAGDGTRRPERFLESGGRGQIRLVRQ